MWGAGAPFSPRARVFLLIFFFFFFYFIDLVNFSSKTPGPILPKRPPFWFWSREGNSPQRVKNRGGGGGSEGNKGGRGKTKGGENKLRFWDTDYNQTKGPTEKKREGGHRRHTQRGQGGGGGGGKNGGEKQKMRGTVCGPKGAGGGGGGRGGGGCGCRDNRGGGTVTGQGGGWGGGPRGPAGNREGLFRRQNARTPNRGTGAQVVRGPGVMDIFSAYKPEKPPPPPPTDCFFFFFQKPFAGRLAVFCWAKPGPPEGAMAPRGTQLEAQPPPRGGGWIHPRVPTRGGARRCYFYPGGGGQPKPPHNRMGQQGFKNKTPSPKKKLVRFFRFGGGLGEGKKKHRGGGGWGGPPGERNKDKKGGENWRGGQQGPNGGW